MAVEAATHAYELPEGVTLTSDERVVAGGRFMFSNLLFFLHWRMAVTSKRLVGHTPNTILGVIPLGSTDVSYPLANIAGVTTRTAYSFFWILVGVIFVLGGLGAPNVVALLIGLLAFLAAFNAEISVTNSGGGKTGHRIAFFDRGNARLFADDVNRAIATYAHQATVVVAPAATNTPTNTADRLSELARLRDAGHVSAEEYEAKRRDILGGL